MPRGVSASTFLESVVAGTAFVAAHRLRNERTREVSEKITGVTLGRGSQLLRPRIQVDAFLNKFRSA